MWVCVCGACSASDNALGQAAGGGGVVAPGNAAPASGGTLANYLVSGYWEWSGYAGGEPRSWAKATITYNFDDMAISDRERIELALDLWSDVTGINFVKTNNSGDLTFVNDSSGAFTTMSTSGTDITKATVNISSTWSGGATADLYGYRTQTFIHEIGHALGLGHMGPYNGAADYASDAAFANDSWQVSVMSYFSQEDNPTVNASYSYVLTPQLADIMAMQILYGVSSARSGDTVYGVGNNTGSDAFGVFDEEAFPSITIYDTGGIDLLNYSRTDLDQIINLAGGAISSIYGETGNLVIFTSSLIENATSGDGNDQLFGNGAANVLIGSGGNDKLDGRAGADNLSGGLGADQLFGGVHNDILSGGPGGDVLNGGDGLDTTSYTSSTSAVTVYLASGGVVTGGDATGDKLVSIEGVIGSKYYDKLVGDSAANIITGGFGRDAMAGGAGADRFDFNHMSETGIDFGARDMITDFQHLVDVIDLSTIDASTILAGNNVFLWRGTGAFTTSQHGEVRYEQLDSAGTVNDYTVVWCDVDADTSAEFGITFKGLINLTAVDFIL